MELTVVNKKLITEPIKHLFTQGEKNVDSIKISLPKMYGEIDLSQLSFKIRGASAENTIAEQILTKNSAGENIELIWTVTENFTAVGGALSLELVGVSFDGSEVIKITSGDIYVKENLLGSYAPPEDVIENALSQMQIAVAQAVAEADRAREYVGKSAYDIWLEEGNTGEISDFLNSLKGERGDDGTGLKILGSLATLESLNSLYPDGSVLTGGFIISNEYYYWDILTGSWTSAGSLQGAKGDKGDAGPRGESGKASIIADMSADTAILAVTDNTEYHYSILSALTVAFPNSSFNSFICFSSGDIATTVNFPTGTKFLGEDVFNEIFSPVSGKRYSLGMWFDGINNLVVVGGYYESN